MITHPDLVTSAEKLREVSEVLLKETIVAFDTEFIRETTFFPSVEILQIATRKESWLIDARAFRDPETRPGFSSLRAVLENPQILKIVHAAQGDQECLYTTWGFVATPTLDTALAASICGFGDGIGLGNLMKALMGVTIKKGHARTNWAQRPLPHQLVEYAHADVEFLVEGAEKLLSMLDKKGRREWALELSAKFEDQSLYESDPVQIANRLSKNGRLDARGYAALIELVKWREDRVRALNVPRRWVADDPVLVDIAHVRPKDVAHLSTFRGINKGELKHSGEVILEALVRSGANVGNVKMPEFKRPEVPNSHETQVMDLLNCYVGILADEHNVAQRHLLTAAQMLPLLRSKAQTWQEWKDQGLLSAYAAELIGEEVMAFLRGKRALSIDRNRVKVVTVG